MRKKYHLMCAVFCLIMSTGFAASTDRWLHVRVDNSTGDREKVRVNVPLALVEKVLPLIQSEELKHGRIQLGDNDLNGMDLRAIFDAVRTSPDGEFVSVQSDKETIRVSKTAGYLLVNSDPDASGKGKITARIPLAVVEALVSGGRGELDILAAVRALSNFGDGELVTVNDDNTQVRVWIDGQNVSK